MKVKELIELLNKLDSSGEKEVKLCIDLEWTEYIRSLESDVFQVSEQYNLILINC